MLKRDNGNTKVVDLTLIFRMRAALISPRQKHQNAIDETLRNSKVLVSGR